MYPYTYFLIVFENTIEINLLEYECVKTKYVYNIFIMIYNLYNIKYIYIYHNNYKHIFKCKI